MRKSHGILVLAALAATAVARLVPASIADFAKALQGASSLKADYSVIATSGVKERYSIALKKPNLLRIDTPKETFVSDGKELITLDKSEGYYYRQPADAATIKALFAPESLNVWSGFFDEGALKPSTSRALGSRARGGMTLDAVQATYGAGRTVTYYLDAKDRIARQAVAELTASGDKRTLIVNALDLQVDGSLSPDEFAFKAPDGSKETTLEALSADKWLTNLEEAKSVAAKTGKRIFVDFMATWCGPCKMLDSDVLQTDRFRGIAKKKLVLLRIDVDAQPSIASQYGVDAMPTQMVLDKDGRILGKTVGYGGAEAFYGFLNSFL